jgi:hypothetical protein
LRDRVETPRRASDTCLSLSLVCLVARRSLGRLGSTRGGINADRVRTKGSAVSTLCAARRRLHCTRPTRRILPRDRFGHRSPAQWNRGCQKQHTADEPSQASRSLPAAIPTMPALEAAPLSASTVPVGRWLSAD